MKEETWITLLFRTTLHCSVLFYRQRASEKKWVTCLNYAFHSQHELKWFGKNLSWYHEREKHYWYHQEGWTVMKDCFLPQGKCCQVYCKLLSFAILQWKITYLEFISFFVIVRLRRNGKVSLFLSYMIIDFTTICWESRVGPSVTASQRKQQGHKEVLKPKQLACGWEPGERKGWLEVFIVRVANIV